MGNRERYLCPYFTLVPVSLVLFRVLDDHRDPVASFPSSLA